MATVAVVPAGATGLPAGTARRAPSSPSVDATRAAVSSTEFAVAGCTQWPVPTGVTSVQVDATGAAGWTVGSYAAGTGDLVSADVSGLSDDQALDVCVDFGGGFGGITALVNASGGGASGVSLGSDFSEPVVVAGGGGGSSGGAGGNAGWPDGAAGGSSFVQDLGTASGGGGGTQSSFGAGGGVSFFGEPGTEGAMFDASGPGFGGEGGSGGPGAGGGGGGYYGGGGGGDNGGSGGGGGGGSDYCSTSPSVTDCAVSAGVGTQSTAGSAPGDAQVILSYVVPVSSISLADSTTSTGYGAAGDDIPFSYVVTNTGTTTLTGVGVADNLGLTISCPDSVLAPGAPETCSGTYTVSQADVDAGSVTDTASAIGANPQSVSVSSSPQSVTVLASYATPGLAVSVFTRSAGYGPGAVTIPFTYVVTNDGTVTVTDVGVSDSLGVTISCSQSPLSPNASVNCTGFYTTGPADDTAGSVTDTATASGTDPEADALFSPPSSALTVQYLPVALDQSSPTSDSAIQGTDYSNQLSVSNPVAGAGAPVWSTTTSASPVTVDSDGLVSTPSSTPAGDYTVAGNVRDGYGDCGPWSFTLDVLAPTVDVAGITDQVGVSGTTIIAMGVGATDNSPTAILSYTDNATLPPGLSVDADTGIISGDPNTAGTYDVTITVSDQYGANGQVSFVWVVSNDITASSPGYKVGSVGTPINAVDIAASDTSSTATLQYSAANLPPGLTINSLSGVITGTPATAGTYRVTLDITDGTGASAQAAFTWRIIPLPWSGPAAAGLTGVKAHDASGFYLGLKPGHGNSWQLYVTQSTETPGGQYTGTITINRGSFTGVKGLRLESGDTVTHDPGSSTITFSFHNKGRLDGIVFTTPNVATTLSLTLDIDGNAATPSQVFLGPNRSNPSAVDPLTITRGPTASPKMPPRGASGERRGGNSLKAEHVRGRRETIS